jgi:hypothetical protein
LGSDKDSNIAAEVDGRLDDLFGDDDGQSEGQFESRDSEPEAAGKKFEQEYSRQGAGDEENEMVSQSKEPVIKDLKSVILSLEWEITDPVMQKLGEEIDRLKEVCKDDKIVVAFLQLLDSLGKYIQKKQAEAHPDSISLLNSVFENLETIMLSPEMNESAKKKMLVAQVNKYKELKKHIASGKISATPSGATERTVLTSEPDEKIEEPLTSPIIQEPSVIGGDEDGFSSGSTFSPGQEDAVVHALKQINETIKAEFKLLREELKSLLRDRQ